MIYRCKNNKLGTDYMKVNLILFVLRYVIRTSIIKNQYLKLLPPKNSRNNEVGGNSLSCTDTKYDRNRKSRWASEYAEQLLGTLRRRGSA